MSIELFEPGSEANQRANRAEAEIREYEQAIAPLQHDSESGPQAVKRAVARALDASGTVRKLMEAVSVAASRVSDFNALLMPFAQDNETDIDTARRVVQKAALLDALEALLNAGKAVTLYSVGFTCRAWQHEPEPHQWTVGGKGDTPAEAIAAMLDAAKEQAQ